MPLDPNIILGSNASQQAPQLQNPMDIAMKGMSLRDLAMKSQMQTQDFNDQQAVRSAYKNNTSVGPDGQPNFNRSGIMSELGQTAPTQVMPQAMQFRQSDAAAQEAQLKQVQGMHDMSYQLAMSVPTGPDVPLAQKNEAYHAARSKAIQLGLPGAEQSPPDFPGDVAMTSAKMQSMSMKDQADLQLKQQQVQNEKQTNQIKLAELQKSIGDSNNKDAQTMSEMLDKGWTARSGQAGAVQDKINKVESLKTLLAQGKSQQGGLDSRQTAELATGLASLYGGGAAGEEAVHRLLPDTWVGKGKSLQEKVSNQPVGLDQQDFANRMEESIDRVNQVAQEQKKQYQVQAVAPFERLKNTNPNLYTNILKSKDIDPSMIDEKGRYIKGSATQGQAPQSSQPQVHPQDSAAVAWAKANSKDPRAAKILQLNGSGQ